MTKWLVPSEIHDVGEYFESIQTSITRYIAERFSDHSSNLQRKANMSSVRREASSPPLGTDCGLRSEVTNSVSLEFYSVLQYFMEAIPHQLSASQSRHDQNVVSNWRLNLLSSITILGGILIDFFRWHSPL